MSPTLVLIVYCILIVAASLFGGWLPSLVRLTHTRLQLMMSCVGGLMLGIAIFHLLPHAVNAQVSLDRALIWLMGGLLTTFFLIRVFHSHQHAPLEESEEECHDHSHDHSHDHAASGGKHRWIGVFVGLSLHTLLDGAALGAAVLSDYEHTPHMLLFGLAVFLGVVLHKPLDSLSIATLMAGGGWELRARQFVNLAYATMCPVGAALFFFGVRGSAQQDLIVGCSLAFASGIFLCISMGDLLPELEFHAHDRIKLTAALLVGVALAYGIGFLEPAHVHSHSGTAESAHHDHTGHDHTGHDHAGHDH
ncbi:MAG: ZIP family metal transporter [Pirellulaceae bacterium]|nr:ZIP family metal transporter [Pirellulaceae bacterium]